MNTTVGLINTGSRKKKPEVSIRNRLKRQRYSDTDPNLRRFQRPCNHNTNSLKCSLVKISDIKNARKKFYEESAKSDLKVKKGW
ncbi:hypothetical protein QE152_g34490 [Popillia japonica]|uniref:Uncharacterized protein n=1 Tax=Popillia japonica TaxID=7064 RepID=A0AAW1IT89_POPJA